MELHRLLAERFDLGYKGKDEESSSDPELFVAESPVVVAILGEERERVLQLRCDKSPDEGEVKVAFDVDGVFFCCVTVGALTAGLG